MQSKPRPPHTIAENHTSCSCVEDDFLYLSGAYAAGKHEVLESFGITHIINAAAGEKDILEKEDHKKFVYLHLRLSDMPKQDLSSAIDAAVDFINLCKKDNGRVLVHCRKSDVTNCLLCYIFMKYHHAVQSHLSSDHESI